MKKKGYPRGNPPEDMEKLRLWWEEEMRKCGLDGTVVIEYAPFSVQQPAQSLGKRLFESLVMNYATTANAHLYSTTIPGAPWPLEAVVMTTEAGMVTKIVYGAVLNAPITAEVSFKKSVGMIGDKLEVEGPGAEPFATQKPLLKKIKDGISLRYAPPLFGFVTSQKLLKLPEVSVTLRPNPAGGEAVICTTAWDEAAFIGRHYSLGLAKALDILKAIEQVSNALRGEMGSPRAA
ncbi:MAG: hypothetical protein P4N24_04200 [Acidobacteriota bacterium]|nr:hypothetical protein [Acidobacteriota bacterium]